MTASAHDIAAALRERLPGLPTVKLHKLLYYCQGHHLATFDEPLFAEGIYAWDMGPVVKALWGHEKNDGPRGPQAELGEAELNTVGYVVSRYGGLTGKDLARLSHQESPWLCADQSRPSGGSVAIKHEWIRDFFTGDGAPEGDEDVFSSPEAAEWRRQIREHRMPATPGRPDSLERLLAWAARG